MAKAKRIQEADGVYFLKLLLFFIISSIWLRSSRLPVPIPVGLLISAVFARYEHFQIDRKVEYAVMLVAALVSLAGFSLTISA